MNTFILGVLSNIRNIARASLKMVNVTVEAVNEKSEFYNITKLQGNSGEIEVYQLTTLVSIWRKTRLASVYLYLMVASIKSIVVKTVLVAFSLMLLLVRNNFSYQGQEEFTDDNKHQKRKDFLKQKKKIKENKIKTALSNAKVAVKKMTKKKKDKDKHLSYHSNEANNAAMWRAFQDDIDFIDEVYESVNSQGDGFSIGEQLDVESIDVDLFSSFEDISNSFDTLNPLEESTFLYSALSRVINFKNIVTKKDFEIWVSYFYALYKSVDLAHACSITILCLHNYMPSSFFDVFKHYMSELISPTRDLQEQSGEFIAKVKDIVKKWKDIRSSEFVDKIKRIIALAVSAGMCQISSIPFGKESFEKFYKTSGVSRISKMDFFEQMLDTIIFIYEKFSHFYTSGDILSMFYNQDRSGEYESEYSTLVSTLTLLQTGNLKKNDFDEHSYEDRVDKIISKTEDLIRTTQGIEKKLFSDRLLVLKKTKVAILDYHKSMSLRERPFSFLMYGGSGVGKSTMLPKIINALLQANNLATSEDLIVTLQANDAFQSEYRTKHSVVILDDIANSTPEYCESNPNNIIINFNNNIPAYALSPIADLKGKILINPKFFIGTTNNKQLFANIYSVEPISILRRFDYTISVSVKNEYLKDGRLNTDIVSGFDIDAWEFKVEIPYSIDRIGSTVKGVDYRIVEHNGILLDKCSLGRLIGFLSHKSQLHFEKQRALVNQSESAIGSEVCPHFSYGNICPDCLNNQAGCKDVGKYILHQWNNIPNCVFLISSYYRIFSCKFVMFILVNMIKYKFHRNLVMVIFAYNMIISYCFMFLVYNIVYTPVFCVVILPPFFAGLFTLILILSYIEYTKNYVMKMPTKTIHDYLEKLKPYRKHCVRLVQIVSIIVALRIIYKLYLKYKICSQGADISIPVASDNEKINVWKIPAVSPILHFPEISNMTHEQVQELVSKNLSHATFESTDREKCCKCDIFPIKSNYWLAPWHVLRKNYDKLHVIRSDPSLIGPNFFTKLSPNSYMRVGATDLGIIYIPAGGDSRDLRKLFPNNSLNRSLPGRMIYKDSDANVKVDDFNCSSYFFSKDDVKYSGYTYNCSFPTFEGLCMATIISLSKVPVILGFHLAGITNGRKGVAQNITSFEIDETIEQLQTSSIVFQTASSTNLTLDVPEMNISHSLIIHDKSPSRYLSDGAVLEHLGSHSGVRRKFTSSVVRTIISDSVEKYLGISCKHGPPRLIGTYFPWNSELEKLVHLKQLIPYLLELAYDDFYRKIFNYLYKHTKDKSKIHPISNVTILSGADGVYGIDSINLKASSGWPLNIKKSKLVHQIPSEGTGATVALDCDPEFWAKIEAMEEDLAQGKRIYLIHRANLKDEPTKLTKDKVRVFAGTPFEGLVLVRKYFLTICKYIMEHSELFECAVGINHSGPDWTTLTKVMLKFGENRVIAGDYKDFDSSMPCEVTLCAMKLMIEIAQWAGYTERQLTIMRGLATEICMPVYEFNGEFIKVNGSNPSGHSLTVFLNNIVNSLYLRYAYYDVYNGTPPGSFADNVSVMCYGDDNKMSVRVGSDLYNHTSIANSLAKCGIIYTMADKEAISVPFINNSQCNFLKRSSVWSDKYNLYLAPIEKDSIFKTLHCVLASKFLTKQEQAAECIMNSMREFFHYGEEEYNLRRNQLLQVVDECRLRPYLPEETLMTFAEEEERFLYKSDLLE